MKSRTIKVLILIAVQILCTSCSPSTKIEDVTDNKPGESGIQENDTVDAITPKSEKHEVSKTQEDQTDRSEEAKEELSAADVLGVEETALFEDMSRYSFSFSSGVGGWGTDLSINPDGSFTGHYSDSDMGSTGEGYPNGTLYYCEFSGRFTTPVFVDEYTYMTEIEALKYSEDPEKEEIEDDGIRYISSTAYGLEEAKTIYIYKPGKPYSELPEGYVWWVNAPTGGAIEDDKNGEMEDYGIYNENADCGFISYQHDFNREDILRIFEKDKEKHKKNDARFYNEAMDQFSMNMLTYEEFLMWDNLLNDLWSYLKKTLDEDTMQALTEEQRKWIKEKNETVSRESAEVEGGSMQPQIENGVAARITRERVEYLIREYIE